MAKRHPFKKAKPGEGRVDVVARLCMVVDWCIDHPEYTAKIKKKYLIASIKPTKVKTAPASVLLLLRNFADKMDGK